MNLPPLPVRHTCSTRKTHMLYLIVLPPPLQPGLYDVTEVSAKRAGKLINHYAERGQLESRVTFASTAAVLSELGRIRIDVPAKVPPLPRLKEGEILLQAKLKPEWQKPYEGERLYADSFEFLLIKYSE